MKNFKYLLAVAMTSVFVFSGCSASSGPGNPDDVVKEAFVNFYDLNSYAYEATVNKLDMAVQGEKMNLNFTMSGAQDMTDQKDPRLTLAFDGSGSLEEPDSKGSKAEGSAKAELRINKDNFYFILENVTGFKDQLPAELIDSLVGKWWNMPVPAGTFEELTLTSGDEENLTGEEKEMRELMKETLFIKDLKYLGSSNGNYEYSGALDEDAVIAFMKKLAEINGATVNDGDIEDMNKFFESFNMDGKILVDKDTMTLSGGSVNLEYKNEAEDTNVMLEAEGTLSKFNERVEIEKPADSEEFNPMMLLGMPSDAEMPADFAY